MTIILIISILIAFVLGALVFWAGIMFASRTEGLRFGEIDEHDIINIPANPDKNPEKKPEKGNDPNWEDDSA